MKHTLFSILLLPLLLFTGCTTYPPEMTKLDIWRERSDNMIIQDYDSSGTAAWKVTKRVFYDIITLGIMETRYAQIKRNLRFYTTVYNECKFYDSLIGKPRKELFQYFGAPHSIADDGDGGKILIWSKEKVSGRANTFAGTSYGKYGAFTSGTTNINYQSEIMSRQFFIDSKDKIYLWKTTDQNIFGVMPEVIARKHIILSF